MYSTDQLSMWLLYKFLPREGLRDIPLPDQMILLPLKTKREKHVFRKCCHVLLYCPSRNVAQVAFLNSTKKVAQMYLYPKTKKVQIQ